MSGNIRESKDPLGLPQRILSRLLERVPLRIVKLCTPGLSVEPNVLVRSPERLELGRHVTIQRNSIIHCGGRKWCDFRGKVTLGDHVTIGPNNILYGTGEIFIDEYAHLGPGVSIISQAGLHSGKRLAAVPDYSFEPIRLGKGCWIGAGAVILGGTSLGDNCTVGPNTVVKGHYPENTTLIGNPARVAPSIDK